MIHLNNIKNITNKILLCLTLVFTFIFFIAVQVKGINNPNILDTIDECVDTSKAYETNAIYREYERESDVYKVFKKITTLSKNTNNDNTYIIYKIEDLSSIEVVTYYYEMTRTNFNRFKFYGSVDNISYDEIVEESFLEEASKPFVELDVYFRCTYVLSNVKDYYYFKIEWPKLAGNWWNNSLVSTTPIKGITQKDNVDIEILDINNNPINNAFVHIGHSEYVTNQEGIVNVLLKEGIHQVGVLVPGYSTATHTIVNDKTQNKYTIKLSNYNNNVVLPLLNFYGFYYGAGMDSLRADESEIIEGNINFKDNSLIITPTPDTSHLIVGKKIGYINFNEVEQLTFDVKGSGKYSIKLRSKETEKIVSFDIDSEEFLTEIIDFRSLNFFGIKDFYLEIIVSSAEDSIITFTNFNFYGNFDNFSKEFNVEVTFMDEIKNLPISEANITIDGVNYKSDKNGIIYLSLTNGAHYYTFNYKNKEASGILNIDSDYNNSNTINKIIYYQLIQPNNNIKPLNKVVILLLTVFIGANTWAIIWYYKQSQKGHKL